MQPKRRAYPGWQRAPCGPPSRSAAARCRNKSTAPSTPKVSTCLACRGRCYRAPSIPCRCLRGRSPAAQTGPSLAGMCQTLLLTFSQQLCEESFRSGYGSLMTRSNSYVAPAHTSSVRFLALACGCLRAESLYSTSYLAPFWCSPFPKPRTAGCTTLILLHQHRAAHVRLHASIGTALVRIVPCCWHLCSSVWFCSFLTAVVGS